VSDSPPGPCYNAQQPRIDGELPMIDPRLIVVIAAFLITGLTAPPAPAQDDTGTSDADKALLRELLAPTKSDDTKDKPQEDTPEPDKPSAERGEAPDQSPKPSDASDSKSTPTSIADLDETQAQYWRNYWHDAARVYAPVDGEYYLCANWTPRFPSSRHITPSKWQSENTTVRRTNSGFLVQTEKQKPPMDEALAAAMSLPELAPNHYGYIHSAKVVKVVSPTEMIVTDIELVDTEKVQAEINRVEQRAQRIIAEQEHRERLERERERERRRRNNNIRRDRDRDRDRNEDRNELDMSDVRDAIEFRYSQRQELIKRQEQFGRTTVRLLGYPTAGATPGTRYTGYDRRGMQIAIVERSGESSSSRRSRGRQLTAVNAELLRKGVTEQQFVELLAGRGLSPVDYINLVREKIQLVPGGMEQAQPHVLAALEQARGEHQEATRDAPEAGDRKADREDDNPLSELGKPSRDRGDKDKSDGDADGEKDDPISKLGKPSDRSER